MPFSRSIPFSFPFFAFLFLLSCAGGDEKAENSSAKAEKEKDTGKESAEARVLFFGNSLTAGQGVGQEKAYPAVIQKKIDSLGWELEVINAGVSGETSAGGRTRVEWVLEQQEPELFVLELGANDGLRGVEPSETRKNLQAIIDEVRACCPDTRIVLAGMKVPPNMGRSYGEKFEAIYPELAEKNGIELIPFLLKGVAGEEELNQSDGIHPTEEGHRIVAETVWEHLRDELRAIAGEKKASDGSDDLELDRDGGGEG